MCCHIGQYISVELFDIVDFSLNAEAKVNVFFEPVIAMTWQTPMTPKVRGILRNTAVTTSVGILIVHGPVGKLI